MKYALVLKVNDNNENNESRNNSNAIVTLRNYFHYHLKKDNSASENLNFHRFLDAVINRDIKID